MTEAHPVLKPPQHADESPPPEAFYAFRVLVPVSNPKTAPHLIELASSLIHPEKGKIKVLFVITPNPYAGAQDGVAEAVERAQDQGLPAELITINAANPARGVLDAAREQNADLIVLGFQTPGEGKVVIGPVTEAIARVVPHDLIVYRHVAEAPVQRIVVPVTTLEGSRVAMIHALHLADVYEVPIIALFVRGALPSRFQSDSEIPFWLQRAKIYDAIYELPGSEDVDTQVIHANDLVAGVKDHCNETDLIVLSVEPNRSGLERWLFGITSQKMLRLAPGSLALVRRAPIEHSRWQRVARQIAHWTPTLTVGERTDVIQQATDLARPNTNFAVMIVLSSILASMGLLLNSAAVVIGAMLVAPMMSPLMGFGVGLAIGHLEMMRRSAVTVIQGVLSVVVVAAVLGLLFAPPQPTAEMLARGQPNLLDMVVALASGAAGAFALARRDIPAALAGVAIAAALVPPICTTGLAIAFGDFSLMVGAGTLSLVNILSISIAAASVFAVMGIHQEGTVPLRQRAVVSTAVLLLLALPLGLLLRNNYVHLNAQYEVETVLEDRLSDAHVMEIEISGRDPLEIVATIRTPNLVTRQQITNVEAIIEDRLERDVTLDVVVLRVVDVD